MPALRKIKRKDLDVKKYSEALNSAVNYRIYAEYWYLDVLTGGKWECLVFGDYEAIMPMPLQYKLGFKFVTQPAFCQQLGVFYHHEIPAEVFREFEKKLHRYRVRAYHFNEENTRDFQPEGELRPNQILVLNKPYELIKKGYKKGRKSDLSLARRKKIEMGKSRDFKILIDLVYSQLQFMPRLLDKKTAVRLLDELNAKNKIVLFRAQNPSDPEDYAFRAFLDSDNRKILLLAARNKKYPDKGKDTLLADHIIRIFSGDESILDFEGSAHPGISFFNESLGAQTNQYCVYSNFKII